MANESAAPIFHHPVIDSTNDEAFRQSEKSAPNGTVVTADYQTKGRGQPGHEWWMPAGKGILLSILLRKLPSGIEFNGLTVHVGWQLARLIERATDLRVDVKLPNDLMIQGRKVGGILCEARWRGDELICVVIGVGINVNVMDFPDELQNVATSLAKATGRELDLVKLRAELIECLRRL